MEAARKANDDTIVAIATPPGRGGVGIVRISGSRVTAVAEAVLGKLPSPRHAFYSSFLASDNGVIDEGIALFFPCPHSFTGEDVLELQCHGSPIVLDMLVRRILELEVRLARPGEFSERAFLNDKLDLTQAEAIADLIDAGSEQAARAALRSLQGEFSQAIHVLVDKIIHLRMYVEAAIDFPEEEIDFLSDGKIAAQLAVILQEQEKLYQNAQQGAMLKEGLTIVIAGRPNAGKSSLLNRLSGRESAIVTDIAGTTRDVLREQIQIDGIPLHVIDTAGLRDSQDVVEQEGIRRAWHEIKQADHIILVVDKLQTPPAEVTQLLTELRRQVSDQLPLTVIRNKIDLTIDQPGFVKQNGITFIDLSAKTGAGFELLKQHLKESAGIYTQFDGNFIARRRHLDALKRAHEFLLKGQEQLLNYRAGELLAEELRQAQQALNEITGQFTTDDLLGKIFSSFCIGK